MPYSDFKTDCFEVRIRQDKFYFIDIDANIKIWYNSIELCIPFNLA